MQGVYDMNFDALYFVYTPYADLKYWDVYIGIGRLSKLYKILPHSLIWQVGGNEKIITLKIKILKFILVRN